VSARDALAMTLPGLDALPPERLRQKALSQWHTPADAASKLARWTGAASRAWRVLEPSAGGGALIRPLLDIAPAASVDAVELDPRWANRLRDELGGDRVRVECANYLTRRAPREPYDLSLMNTPYEDGLDGLFLAKAMAESRRVTALVRLATLAGQARHREVWSRVESGEWHLAALAVFSARPIFLAAGEESDGGKTEFAAVKLERADVATRTGTQVEWWA
jgi:predicted RNA methylase